jgi:hypothetical protein
MSARKAGTTRGNSSQEAISAGPQGRARRRSRVTMMPATAGARPISPARTMPVTLASSLPASNVMNNAATSSVAMATRARPCGRPSSHGKAKMPRTTIRAIVMGPDSVVGIEIKDRTRLGQDHAGIDSPDMLLAASPGSERIANPLFVPRARTPSSSARLPVRSRAITSRVRRLPCSTQSVSRRLSDQSQKRVPATNDSTNPSPCTAIGSVAQATEATEATGGGRCCHRDMRGCCSGASDAGLAYAPFCNRTAARDPDCVDRSADPKHVISREFRADDPSDRVLSQPEGAAREIGVFGSSAVVLELGRIGPEGRFVRPRIMVGRNSTELRYWLHEAGIHAERCMLPMVRTRAKRDPESGKLGATVMLSARCTFH